MSQDIPAQVLHPTSVLASRREKLSSAQFWTLMERWQVSTSQALHLIGQNDQPRAPDEKPSFRMSEEQIKVLSCLLEIDLTLTLCGMPVDRLHRKIRSSRIGETSSLDAMGCCDPSRTATVLWGLNEANPKTFVKSDGG